MIKKLFSKGLKGFESQLVIEILYNKERAGLKTQNFARIIVILFYLPASIILAQSNFERIFSTAILIIAILCTLMFLFLIKRGKNLKLIGILGSLLDVCILGALVITWYLTVGGTNVSASFLLKNAITLISILFVIINSQAMRPLYPLIVTFGAIFIHVLIFIYACNFPGIQFASNYLEAFTTIKLSTEAFMSQVFILLGSGIFASYLNYNVQKTIVSAANLERTNNQLGRFFSPNVAETISQSADDFAEIGGQIQDVAVLFSDIRNFTALSESLPPQEVLNFLSEYHELMVAIIFSHGGTLDKFIGDAIMATFGTPDTNDDDALRSVKAAIEMENALEQFNENRLEKGLFAINHGIGIHYGPVLVGNIGTRERLEYTVLGDAVNVASRIESSCKKVGKSLLFSHEVYENIKDKIETKRIGEIGVKGKSKNIILYTC